MSFQGDTHKLLKAKSVKIENSVGRNFFALSDIVLGFTEFLFKLYCAEFLFAHFIRHGGLSKMPYIPT